MSPFFSSFRTAALTTVLFAANAFGAGAILPGFNSTTFLGNDDGSTGLISLGLSANFFGTTYTQAYLNNNGNITFENPLGTFTPFAISGNTGNPIIAPFFADVDTRVGEEMKYGSGTVSGRTAFGVTWDGVGVGYFNQHVNKLNQFQLLLVDRADTGAAGNFDIYFNYDQIQWETGDASGGVNGLGGTAARVGFSNGSGVAGTSLELPGSGINGALLDGGPNSLVANSNVNVAGRFIFQVRNGVIVTPPPPTGSVPDAGSALALLSLAMLALAAAKRKFC